MKTEKIIQKCIAIASLNERRGKLVVKRIRNVAMIEGLIVKEIRELRKIMREEEDHEQGAVHKDRCKYSSEDDRRRREPDRM